MNNCKDFKWIKFGYGFCFASPCYSYKTVWHRSLSRSLIFKLSSRIFIYGLSYHMNHMETEMATYAIRLCLIMLPLSITLPHIIDWTSVCFTLPEYTSTLPEYWDIINQLPSRKHSSSDRDNRLGSIEKFDICDYAKIIASEFFWS